ncbi:hypothetical protein [Candidatus Desulfovibrio trichonymphae]|uniref:hypothetical protein n=1 Tax=Candidatus Desulfovibrio trichonymphae TaxID=1725232 RepID=UPI000BBB1363|nr:hypothetical protein [Candidatus Desulfovibrio trichonymphae]GHU91595.1 hypothetical protein AGMMS49925_07040 [Deltaproteobacteria bacterium]GHU97949.1 hypothetical protein AGMMS50248_03650 [Deltaproteobacteria bacterium]
MPALGFFKMEPWRLHHPLSDSAGRRTPLGQVTPHLQLPLALWQRRSTAQLRKNPAMNDCPAAGIVCWRECQGRLDMLPLVHMHNTQTSCLENTCGSGALSLVRTGGRRDFFIMQSDGSPLDVRLL